MTSPVLSAATTIVGVPVGVPAASLLPEDSQMPAKVKLVLTWILVVFVVYAIVTRPDRAADVVESVWSFLAGAVEGFGRFFSELTS